MLYPHASISLALTRAGSVAAFALLAAQAVSAQTSLPAPPASLQVVITGFSSSKGTVQLAICPAQSKFPDCGKAAVRTAVVPIDDMAAKAQFEGLAEGNYAVSVFHDANGNGRLDTFLGIPREGYGFSRNPAFRTRAPRFSEAEIPVRRGSATNIRLRYIF